MKQRKKRPSTLIPLMLFWSKRDQLRFIQAVEKLCSTCNDLSMLKQMLEETVERLKQVTPARRRKAADRLQAVNGEGGAE